MLCVIAIAALWGVLARSFALALSVLVPGFALALSAPRPWRDVGRDALLLSLWAALVTLYLRLEWGYRAL